METAALLRRTTENDISTALAAAPFGNWPQDEREMLILFHRILDVKIGASLMDAPPMALRNA